MDPYEIRVVAIISGVVIALCVFTLVMELLRMRPGCCWLSPPLEPVDLEKDQGAGVKEEEEGEPAPDISTPIVPTPILKPDSRNTPDKFARQKRVKSASAVRFYAYNRSRSNSSGQTGDQLERKIQIRAKTAGHARRFDKPNGFYGVTFANDSFELIPPKRRSVVSFTPTSRTDDDMDTDLSKMLAGEGELEDEIPEDNTSTISLESKEPCASTTPAKPTTRQSGSVETGKSGSVGTRHSGSVDTRQSGSVDTRQSGSVDTRPSASLETGQSGSVETEQSGSVETRQSVSVETETEPRLDTDAGTQCEAFMLVVRVTYSEAATQTDYDPDFAEVTAVLREVKERSSQGTQMKSPTPPPPSPPPPVCVDTGCGPSTIDLIDPIPIATPQPSPPQREVTPPNPAPKAAPRAKGRVKSRPPGDRRKLRSRGMTLHTAQRAVSGRRSSSSHTRPVIGSGKTHPLLKTNKPINYPTRSLRDKPPREKWQIAAERVYMQQRQSRVKPAKTDKTILGLKTAISEVKSFTTPPTAVYQVTRCVLLIIGEKEEDMPDWRKICNLLGRHGPASPVTRLVNLKNTPLTAYQMGVGRKVVDTISLDEISKVSTGATVLYKWITKLTKQ